MARRLVVGSVVRDVVIDATGGLRWIGVDHGQSRGSRKARCHVENVLERVTSRGRLSVGVVDGGRRFAFVVEVMESNTIWRVWDGVGGGSSCWR